MEPITLDQARGYVESAIPPVFKDLWEKNGQVDFAYAAKGVGRFPP